MKPKLLITGGLGNLGSWLTRHFTALDFDVYVLAKRHRDLPFENPFTFISCDITSLADCREKLSGQAFDFVLHTASVNDTFVDGYADAALAVNAKGTRNLLEVLDKKALKHFVYFSTFHVYGTAHGTVTEETPLRPRHDYATTHLFGELYVKQFHYTHHVPYTVIRLTNSYGCPVDTDTSKWYLVLNDLAKMAFEKEQIVLKGNGKAARDFIWMGSVCEAMEALLQLPEAPNGLFNLSGEASFSMMEIAEAVQAAYHSFSGKRLPVRFNENDSTPHVRDLFVSSQKLKQRISYSTPIMFEEEAAAVFRLLQESKQLSKIPG